MHALSTILSGKSLLTYFGMSTETYFIIRQIRSHKTNWNYLQIFWYFPKMFFFPKCNCQFPKALVWEFSHTANHITTGRVVSLKMPNHSKYPMLSKNEDQIRFCIYIRWYLIYKKDFPNWLDLVYTLSLFFTVYPQTFCLYLTAFKHICGTLCYSH